MHRRKLLFLAGFPKPAAAEHVENAAARFPAGFVAKVLAGSAAVADDGGRFLMSPAERHALVAAHLDGNRALVARHGIADPGGFVELPDPRRPGARRRRSPHARSPRSGASPSPPPAPGATRCAPPGSPPGWRGRSRQWRRAAAGPRPRDAGAL